jgi:hypothetical protein
MKKLILFLTIIAALSIQVAAQDVTIPKAGSNFDVTLTAVDTLSNNSTTLSKVIGVGSKLSVQLYSIQVTVDSISGTPTQAWVLAGSMNNSDYVDIDTVSWTGTDGDTTKRTHVDFKFSNGQVKNLYKPLAYDLEKQGLGKMVKPVRNKAMKKPLENK